MKAFGVDTAGGVDEVVVIVDVENASPRASSVLRGTRKIFRFVRDPLIVHCVMSL